MYLEPQKSDKANLKEPHNLFLTFGLWRIFRLEKALSGLCCLFQLGSRYLIIKQSGPRTYDRYGL